MTHLGHIIHGFAPHNALQIGFELPNRRKMQHTLGLVMALYTVGLQTQVGQAGIGGIDQVKVSNNRPARRNGDAASYETSCVPVTITRSRSKSVRLVAPWYIENP